jgi:hypothetical protein
MHFFIFYCCNPPKKRRQSMRKLMISSMATLAAGVGLAMPAAAQENPAEIIAAHIRMQGYECAKALSAERNRQASKPNEAVWTLRCSNAVYNVRLIPDMAAHVEKVDEAK